MAKGEILMDYLPGAGAGKPQKKKLMVLRLSSRHTAFQAAGFVRKTGRGQNFTANTVIDSLSVMVTHSSEVIKQHAHELLSRQEVVQLVENVKKDSPAVGG